MVWYTQFGFNSNGEMGNGTVQHLQTPWCISKKKINVEKNIFDFEKAGEKGQIRYNTSLEFNLIRETVPGDTCTFKSMDTNVATVNEVTGEITAKGQGYTIIKLYNQKNNLYKSVRVNVNGEGNITNAKIVGGNNHFVALKADGTVYAWGYNGYGNLGIGDKISKVEPVKMKAQIKYIDEDTEEEKTREEEITDVIDIACGVQHTLVLRRDGTVWACRI